MNDNITTPETTPGSELAHGSIVGRFEGDRRRKYGRFALAALGSIPWVGGVLAAVASFSAERDQEGFNELQKLWLEEHEHKIKELGDTLSEIFTRLETFGEQIEDRIKSPEYLALVREAFRSWDQADTAEKKEMLKKLITNAGATTLCSDDVVRLFIHWIDQYHETHFMVIKDIYRHSGSTRGQIWERIKGTRPREDSAEADLFRYLIRELSTGGVIRQERETDAFGNFLKKPKTSTRGHSNPTIESSFEDTKRYDLTELGAQFVHYVMTDVVPQIGGGNPQ